MPEEISPELVAGRSAAPIRQQWADQARLRPAPNSFDAAAVATLPEPAPRWMSHATAPGSPLATAVLLDMRGQFRLGRWLPMRAMQALSPPAGLVWAAQIGFGPLSFRGFDRYGDGHGEMSWRLFGRLPRMHADGPDIDRSAAGRLAGEAIWASAAFLGPHVAWRPGPEPDIATAEWTIGGHTALPDLAVAEDGAPSAVTVRRWGNPAKQPWGEYPFGGSVNEERTFDGFTIPTAMAVGWFYGTDQASEGDSSVSRSPGLDSCDRYHQDVPCLRPVAHSPTIRPSSAI